MADWQSLTLLILLSASLPVWGIGLWRWFAEGRPFLPARAFESPNPAERPSDPLVWLAALFAWMFVPPLALALFPDEFKSALEKPTLQLAQAHLAITGFQLSACALTLAAGRVRPAEAGLQEPAWRADAMAGVWGFLASLAPVYLINDLVSRCGWRDETEVHAFFEILQANPGAMTWVWIVAAAVVAAPLAEELAYRVLLQGMFVRIGRPGLAIAVSSLTFAASHIGGKLGLANALTILPLGVILAYVYHRRRSYLAVVITHALFNAMNLCFAALAALTG